MTKEEYRKKLIELLLEKNMTKDLNERQLIQMKIDSLTSQYKKDFANEVIKRRRR